MKTPTPALLATTTLLTLALAQNVTVPSTCTPGFTAGSDTVLLTIPYTYTQSMSIIGSIKNLTWSGNPDDTVTLNGTDNTVGTARTYDTSGAHVIETILVYSKPATGPYVEVHNTALLSVPSVGVEFYIPFDGTVVTSVCGGAASMFNLTAHFCGSNATVTGAVLHQLHLADAQTVGKFLGGENFTTCEALASSATTSSVVAQYTGGAGAPRAGLLGSIGGTLVLAGLLVS